MEKPTRVKWKVNKTPGGRIYHNLRCEGEWCDAEVGLEDIGLDGHFSTEELEYIARAVRGEIKPPR